MIGVYHYSAAITACDKGGGDQWERAEEIFIDMVKCGVEPNAFTFNALIMVLGNGGQWEKAEAMFIDMVESGVRPNVTGHYIWCHWGHAERWSVRGQLERDLGRYV